MGNQKNGQEAKFASSEVKKGNSSSKRGKGIHELESMISEDGQPNCSSSNPSKNVALPVLNPESQSMDHKSRDTKQSITDYPSKRRRHNLPYNPTSSKDVHNHYPVPVGNIQQIDPNINMSLTLSNGKMSTQRINPCYFDPNISNARSMQQNNACPEVNKNQSRNFWKQTGNEEKENGGYQNEGLVSSGSSPVIRQSMQPLLPGRRYQTDPDTNLSLTWSGGKMSTQRINPCTIKPNILDTTSKQKNNGHSDGNQNQTRNFLDETSKNGRRRNEGIVTSSSFLFGGPAMQAWLPSRQYRARMESANECTYNYCSEPILLSFFPVERNIIEQECQENSTRNQQTESDDDIDVDVDTTLKL